MSAVIQDEYTGNGTKSDYNFTFPYLKTSDIKASLDGVETTAFTLPNATTLQFNTAPGSGVKIKIFRETSVDDLTATFYAGSAIKSEDLNDNFTQNLFKTQEVGGRFISNLGGTMTGNLNMGAGTDIVFEGATDDAHETTLTVADPTADRTITFPNVTGTVVTTGDTGTVATGMIAGDAVNGDKIADNSINSEHYVDGSIDRVHLAADIVDGTKIADDSINSEHYIADSIDSEHYAPGSVNTVAIEDTAVTTAKLAADAVTNAKIADNSIDSEHYVDGSIDAAHLASNSVTNAKMADDSVGTAELQDSSVDTARLADNSVTLAKMTDNSVGTSEIVNAAVTADKIADTAILTGKLANGAVTTVKLAADAVTNDKLADNSVSTENIQDGDVSTAKIASSAVTTAKIASDAVTTVKIPDDAVTTAKIADSELKTLANMQSGTASKLADSTALTADIADLNQIDGLTKQTTISDSDASFPTSGAVVDYVAAQLAPLGGFEAIANEQSFPNTQPASGVVISIADAGGLQVSNSGTASGQTVGGTTVNITGIASNFNGTTVAAGIRFLVASTGSGQNYTYHKATLKEDDLLNLSGDINDFAERYRVGSSNPTSSLDNGDLFFNTSTGKMLVYNGTNTAWEEVQSIGNFFISTLSPAFDGTTQNFTITNAPSNVQQVLLVINGVVQKPNAGTSTPSEGFALDGSTIKLGAAPVAGSTYHAVVLGSTVNIGTPSNNTVTTAILQNSSVTTAKIADESVTLAKLEHGTSSNNGKFLRANNGADPTFEVVNTDLVADTSPQLGGNLDSNGNNIALGDSSGSSSNRIQLGASQDLQLYHNGTDSAIYDSGTGRLKIYSNGAGIDLRKDDGEAMVLANTDGSVELYHNNSKKLETISDGVLVDGTVKINDGSASGNRIAIGNSGDLLLYHDGNNSYIKEGGTGNLYIFSANLRIENADGSKSYIEANDGGATELYYDGSKKLETDAAGVTVTGDVTATSFSGDGSNLTGVSSVGGSTGVDFDDNIKARFGDGNDLEIFHDGSHSKISNSTGYLVQRTNQYKLSNVAEDHTYIKIPTNEGGVELYYDNIRKLTTTSKGVYITDNFLGVNVSASTGTPDGRNAFLGLGDSDTGMAQNGDGQLEAWANNQEIMNFDTGSVTCYKTFLPASNNAQDLGTTGNRWRNIYTNDLNLSNEGSSNDVDNTWGDWTIQEGESDLFLKNNRSGKKYKFNLTEVL